MRSCKMTPLLGTLFYTAFGMLFMLSAVLIGKYAGQSYSSDVLPSPTAQAAVKVDESESYGSTANSCTETPEASPLDMGRLLMIDPGHGGEDGGAVSESGILEKDLNLAASLDIADLCLLFGIPYRLTRTDDRLLYDIYNDFSDYSGKKKSLDLKNRLKFSEEVNATLFLSIHMNNFTDSRYHGLHVYYSANTDESRQLAEIVQSYVKNHLQPYNERCAKQATSAIYLLSNIDIPAILVECGFLSNAAEADRLSSPSYRASLVACVFTPVCEYFVRS